MKKYKCVEDLQGSDWCIGLIDTVEGWRNTALEWAESDNFQGVIAFLKKALNSSVMGFIADFWQIRFEEVDND